ncbi:class I SAM-dependent methyltransferase [Pseudodesulfovibrio tunisiensis]|uniref:class I SAM-dependent methyltransferase n=1 Tax=Pseudodesulfovibrio tunisiensis TaxID=463192 RepID=UPI001FB3920E|nr:class I SAM-dependent methyltransferase [Pseudodesulfovibrio tunisiensis]
MSWNPEHYEDWFKTPEGQYALDREIRLLESVISGWPRRCRKLLEVGCGTGLFLEALWEMGFDVSGVDRDLEMLRTARARLGHRADLQMGNGEHLAFDDNQYDYVFLWSVLEFADEQEEMLAEAARVAEKGILVGFLNRCSLYYHLNVKSDDGPMSKASWLSWPEMRDMVFRVTGYRPTVARSVLPGPQQSWKTTGVANAANRHIYPPWVGAFVAMRVDFKGVRPLTPLPAWRSEPEMG